MYWEEIIELIKTHGKEPKSKFSNEYNDSDRYIVYEYERGTVKTSYLHINEFSKKIKNVLKNILSMELIIFKYSLHLVHQKVWVYMMTKMMF